MMFQNTEYDCAEASFVNALNYLFEREEIPVQFLKTINKYTLDVEGDDHVVGQGGTSRNAIRRIMRAFSKYGDELGLRCEILSGEGVTLDIMRDCLKCGGVIVARCYQKDEHYILITKIDDNFAYVFDPYYLKKEYYVKDEQVAVVLDEMFTHNRLVKIERLMGGSHADFSLMEPEKREVVLISRS